MHEHPDQLPDEQRITSGRRGQPGQEVLRQPGGTQYACGELSGRAGVEAAEVERLGYPPADSDEVGTDLAELGPGERNHEDWHLSHPLGEVLDEVEEQGVGPVDVVENDDQRPAGRQRLDEPAQRPERLLYRARDTGRQAL